MLVALKQQTSYSVLIHLVTCIGTCYVPPFGRYKKVMAEHVFLYVWHRKSRFAVHYHLQQKKLYFLTPNVSWDSSVGIATGYSLDGPGIETRWGRDFTLSSRPTLGPLRPSVHWVTGFFPRGKAAGTWY